MIGTTSPIPASLPLEPVPDPGLERPDVGLGEADIRLGGHEQGRDLALLGPLEATGVKAVVDPGQGAGPGVLLQRFELPVGGAELRAPVEGQMGELGYAQDG